ncbi:DUF1206 domain-containing protein [Actinacidiphila guanduensis]|uniref:DUF1206 domain-containing protein n=1 Tax=Actinacidiphila guanduensis TaxID=310781 RepID=A0A1H0B582_9ACTN|nr:DUF1206 domain-containing protein [Actinacidiphila guanduensis]SDN40483.1 protein of unknown function [Actinacidiphila guanduensis]
MASQSHTGRGWTGASRRSREQALATVGRAGFMARGVIYVLVGYLALRIAFGDGGDQADRQGALQQIASRPFGTALLWLLAAGLAGMAVWRGVQAAVPGAESRKAGSRLMNAGRAVFYAFVCWGTAAYAAGSGGSGNSDSSSKDWTANVLKLPAGRWLTGVAGCALIVVGAVIAVRAAQRRFLRKMETGRMGPKVRTAVAASGVAGGVARGAVYSAAGVFVLLAAIRYDPGSAKGMDDTLRSFDRTAAGPWLLVVVAAGLVLYGCFSFASARWRRL